MKNLFLRFGLALLLFSCTNDDYAVSTEDINANFRLNQSNITSFRILDGDSNIFSNCVFDNEGRISTLTSPYYFIKFTYDEFNKVINATHASYELGTYISENISYNNSNQVLSIGDRTFDYDVSANNYTENIILNYDSETVGNIEIVVNRYERYEFQNTNNPIPQFCVYYEYVETNIITGEVNIYGYCDEDYSYHIDYENNNVINTGGWNNTAYIYDNNINPLYFEGSNLPYILGFLDRAYNGLGTNLLYRIISKNNLTSIHWDSSGGPEISTFLYDLNNDGLPVHSTIQYYYAGTLENERLYANYYYASGSITD